MPFRLLRNDITKVRADAVVNSANPEPRYAAGTDAAIYRAAGEEALLSERKRIGRIAPGEAAPTAAFQLPARYIIHTVGPAWIDGRHGEFGILRSCYRKSLLLAEQLGCASIAFPLIASGSYGFPKDRALEIALSVIREHLEDSDILVTLVLFGYDACLLATGLTEPLEAYIDEHYVARRAREEYGSSVAGVIGAKRRRAFWGRAPFFGGLGPKSLAPDTTENAEEAADEWLRVPAADAVARRPAAEAKKTALEDVVKQLGESFQARLLRMIDERDMSDPEVYKRANIDRKLFSKIRCSADYIPKKKTIVALAIALRLNRDDTEDLLASAGLILTNNSKADVIVSFCIENEIYDIYEVNALLFKFGQPILG